MILTFTYHQPNQGKELEALIDQALLFVKVIPLTVYKPISPSDGNSGLQEADINEILL